MKKTFEKQLPENYREAMTVDAKTKRFTLFATIGAFLITALFCFLAWAVFRPKDLVGNYSIWRNLVLIASLAAYIVLHELVHGLAYKLLTGQKLTFGMTLTVAFCGVPDIYVYRRTALISLLAPFTVFSVVFIALALALRDPWDKFYAGVLFAVHIGGCVGDLYDTFLYLTRFRDPRTLMRDTGPKQTFYVPED